MSACVETMMSQFKNDRSLSGTDVFAIPAAKILHLDDKEIHLGLIDKSVLFYFLFSLLPSAYNTPF